MKAVLVKEWPMLLLDWAQPPHSEMAGSPRRQEIIISGELPGLDGKAQSFLIGTSRDAYGTVLHLTPAQDHPLILKKAKDGGSAEYLQKEKAKSAKTIDGWNHWWAKIAVRSGYMSPLVDPSALNLLSDLRHRNGRVEFIVDTNVLISGVGHWLVRYLGDLCDLVRTVVTDLEIQRFGDTKKWKPTSFEELSTRTCYLMSSRFLEYLQEQHPVWRRLDIEEETALFAAGAPKGGDKEPGNDTLLLRAVRRSIQDQVPGLNRLFVTSDQNAARTALHDLPPGATIAAYIKPIPNAGTYLTSVHWWPTPRGEGAGYMSSLASFSYEATCMCDAVQLTKADGSFLRIVTPDRSQFPSDWREPVVWIETGEPRLNAHSEVSTEPGPVEVATPVSAALSAAAGASAESGAMPASQDQRKGAIKITAPAALAASPPVAWPFVAEELRAPVFCTARASGPAIVEVLAAIMLAVRENRPLSNRVFPGAKGPARELRTFLRAVDALDASGQPGTAAVDLPDIFSKDAADRLSQILTKTSGYSSLIDGLRNKKVARLDALNLPSRSATSLAGIARLLGQAVGHGGELIYGGGYISRDEFIRWFMKTVEAEAKGPLGEALVADISRKALYELSLSPVRLEKAMQAAIPNSPLAELKFNAGGTPERVLEEEVAVLSAKGWMTRTVSADGLLGYRSVGRQK